MMMPKILVISIFFCYFLKSQPITQVSHLEQIINKYGYIPKNNENIVRDVYVSCRSNDEWLLVKNRLLTKYKKSKNLQKCLTDVERQKKALNETDLMKAVLASNEKAVADLLTLNNPNEHRGVAPGISRTALDLATEQLIKSNPENFDVRYGIIIDLLDHGAVPSAYTAQKLVKSKVDKIVLFKRFINNGLQLSQRGKNNVKLSTHLLRIIDESEIELAKLLIENGADLNDKFFINHDYDRLINYKIKKYLSGKKQALPMIKILVEHGVKLDGYEDFFSVLNSPSKYTPNNNIESLAYYFAEHGTMRNIASLAEKFEHHREGSGLELLRRFEGWLYSYASSLADLDEYESLVAKLNNNIGINYYSLSKKIKEFSCDIIYNFKQKYALYVIEKSFTNLHSLSPEVQFYQLSALNSRIEKYEYYPLSIRGQSAYQHFANYLLKQMETIDGNDILLAFIAFKEAHKSIVKNMPSFSLELNSDFKIKLKEVLIDKVVKRFSLDQVDADQSIDDFMFLINWIAQNDDSSFNEFIFDVIRVHGQYVLNQALEKIDAGDVMSLQHLMNKVQPFRSERANLYAYYQEQLKEKISQWINQWLLKESDSKALYGVAEYCRTLKNHGILYVNKNVYNLIYYYVKNILENSKIIMSFSGFRSELNYFIEADFITKKEAQILIAESVKKHTLDILKTRLGLHEHAHSYRLLAGGCSVCEAEGPLWGCGARTLDCRSVCLECLQKIMNVALEKAQNGGQAECNFCHQELLPDIFDEAGLSNPENNALREAFLRTKARRTYIGWQFCHNPDCLNGACFASDEKQRFDCDACFFAGCLVCGRDHDGCRARGIEFLLECGAKIPPEIEINDPNDPSFYDGRYRPCASCGVMTERISGCNGMKCFCCNAQWHWNLGLKSTAHDSDRDEMLYVPLCEAHF